MFGAESNKGESTMSDSFSPMSPPSTFTKWYMVIATVMILGLGTWTFNNVNSTAQAASVSKIEIDRNKQDIRDLRDDIKVIKEKLDMLVEVQLKLLAEQQRANRRP